jgi:hypothetical protein
MKRQRNYPAILDTINKRLDKLLKKHGGRLTSEIILADARRRASPLHKLIFNLPDMMRHEGIYAGKLVRGRFVFPAAFLKKQAAMAKGESDG